MTKRRPKGVSRKRWKHGFDIVEMNHRIIKEKMKDPLYIPNEIDNLLLEQGEYKNKKKK